MNLIHIFYGHQNFKFKIAEVTNRLRGEGRGWVIGGPGEEGGGTQFLVFYQMLYSDFPYLCSLSRDIVNLKKNIV